MNLEIANKLVELRKKNGYSQEELAEKLGLSRQAVSKWERAESSPDTDNLIVLARLYNVSLDDLLSTSASNEEIKEDNMLKESSDTKSDDDVSMTKKQIAIVSIVTTSILFIGLILYIILGFKFDRVWIWGWSLMLMGPFVGSILEAVFKKHPKHVALPLVCVLVYMVCGVYLKAWHIAWVVFLLIPIYYTFCNIFNEE
jgi:transcriptional regulator with XRE-family HTH domain